MNRELYEKMLALLASYAKEGALYPSDDCPACGAPYQGNHERDCLCVVAWWQQEHDRHGCQTKSVPEPAPAAVGPELAASGLPKFCQCQLCTNLRERVRNYAGAGIPDALL